METSRFVAADWRLLTEAERSSVPASFVLVMNLEGGTAFSSAGSVLVRTQTAWAMTPCESPSPEYRADLARQLLSTIRGAKRPTPPQPPPLAEWLKENNTNMVTSCLFGLLMAWVFLATGGSSNETILALGIGTAICWADRTIDAHARRLAELWKQVQR